MRRRRLRLVLLLVGGALVLLGAFTGWQAWRVHASLHEAASQMEATKAALAADDSSAAQKHLDAARSAANSAHRNSSGPVWWTASKLPWIGDDVSAVRIVADVADRLTSNTLPPVIRISDSLSPDRLRPTGGRIALGSIRRAAPVFSKADRELRLELAQVDGIDKPGLLSPVAGPVGELRGKLDHAAGLTATASKASELLPPMLGADGVRYYLLVFQNNAEIRATGGLPGSVALLRADRGRFDLVTQRGTSATPWANVSNPVVRLSSAERTLFTDRLATYALDANVTPDFPRTGQILQRFWEVGEGRRVDGVISVDPVTLSYIMRATGPVALMGGGSLTADNAVPYLLNTVYLQNPDPTVQDRVFEAVARTAFERLTGGALDARALLQGLSRGVQERRVLVWSAHADEQQLIEQTPLADQLEVSAAERRPDVGVFLNDSGSDKMTYYLDHRVDVRSTECNGDGSQVLDVQVRLHSSAPQNGRGLTPYVVGDRSLGYPAGSMRLTVMAYSPPGGDVVHATVNGTQSALARAIHDGRDVGAITIDLGAGDTTVLRYTIRSGPGQTGDPSLRTTPGVRSTGVGTLGNSRC